MEQIRVDLQSQSHFNGYYNRQLVSPFGCIEDIPIPRFREGFMDNSPTVLSSFNDEKSRTWQLLTDMHMMGISQ